MQFSSFLCLSGLFLASEITAHVALIDPPARNVMWRMGFNSLPFHPQDDYLICSDEGSGCPPCGDNVGARLPRQHEAGGQYATGIITKTYSMGEVIDVFVNVSISHGGSIEFKLCQNDNIRQPVDQRCLDQHTLEIVGQRGTKKKLSASYGKIEEIRAKLKLPAGVTCKQCVLQMTQDAEQFLPQTVMFRNCADIAIVDNNKNRESRQRGFKRGPLRSTVGFQRGHIESRPFQERRSFNNRKF